MNKEVLTERERCKKIVERKIESIIAYRTKKIRRHRRLSSVFKKLKDNILFSIDNPNYVRKTSSLS